MWTKNTIFIAVIVAFAVITGIALAVGPDGPASGSDTDNTAQTEQEPAVTPTGVVHEIVLTEDGYEPDAIEINLGDEIVFSTTRGEMFWPASNVHPTHRLYPAFDPEEPVEPDDEWSFVFDKTGEWRFHDHLSPFYTGVITVVE